MCKSCNECLFWYCYGNIVLMPGQECSPVSINTFLLQFMQFRCHFIEVTCAWNVSTEFKVNILTYRSAIHKSCLEWHTPVTLVTEICKTPKWTRMIICICWFALHAQKELSMQTNILVGSRETGACDCVQLKYESHPSGVFQVKFELKICWSHVIW